MTQLTEQFMHRVAATEHWIPPLVAQHLEANFGQMLPHILMGRITSEAAARASDPTQVQALLALLEEEFGGGKDVDEVIAFSFVEMLPYPGEPGRELNSLLGPKLTAQLARDRPPGDR